MKTKKLFYLTLLLIVVLFPGCKKKDEVLQIDLPPTSVLSVQSSWAVIKSTHLRLRQSPTLEGEAVTTLWKGSVLEVLSRTNNQEIVEGEDDYWYQINFGGLTGWVFGAYLEMFTSKEKAEAFSRELK